ncbi:cell division protein FtsQ [Streptomyces glaucosporus]|uniref:Cell division protein FtsQ n=1 Tax=Streptomyces glaucosporus TaxID=284044 RepID=A0ABN3IX02_9ACTN
MAGRTPTAERGAGGPARPGRGAAPARTARPGDRRRRRLLLVLALAPALVLGGFALWLLYGSPWLRVEGVTVEGERVLTERQVLETAAVPVGDPLVSVDPEEVERRLRDGLLRIDSVEVVRSWPHGIEVRVAERRPVAVMAEDAHDGGDRGYAEVDDEGVRFGTVAERPAGVPLLVVDLADSPSRHRFGAERMRREAVKVASALPGGVRGDTRTIRVRSYDSITLELTGGRTVVWGSSERSAAKADSLVLLMKAADGAERFDVSVPGAPAASGS